ncbi:hypothetical protein [Salisediminibacterium beveridgei]|uniref:hypothetical protein n=1 Tax=Salisediminibacterium beveridgei TaxID=632773 RepID=UPI0012ED7A83|nr:hypothetical protein [Salisediminibacterium beveridgei]
MSNVIRYYIGFMLFFSVLIPLLLFAVGSTSEPLIVFVLVVIMNHLIISQVSRWLTA